MGVLAAGGGSVTGSACGVACSQLIHNLRPGTATKAALCDRDSLWVGIYAFKAASSIYAPLFLLSALLSKKIADPRFVVFKLVPSIARSSLFIATTGFFWVRFACLARQITGGHHRINYFLGAFAAAIIGLLIEKKERRSELNVYICQQSVEVLFRMLQTRKLVRPVRGGMAVLFGVAMSVLYYCSHHRREVLPGSTRGLMTVALGEEDKADPLEAKLHSASLSVVPQQLHSRRTPLCKHRSGCTRHALIGMARSFLVGVGLSSALAVVPKLLSGKIPKMSSLVKPSNARLGLFLACINGTARSIRCMLRGIRGKEDGLNQSVAGFMGGLCFVINGSTEVGLYVASKAAESLFAMLVNRGTIKPLPNGELLTFGLASAVIFYASLWEPYVLRPSYFHFLHKASAGRYGIITRNFAPVREEVGVPALEEYAAWKTKMAEFFSKLPVG